ncbi:MAG TPA: hypothetical protein VGH32_12910 [Pirellulales bacterium]
MHCVRFEMRLNELLDERASPEADRELLDHAQDCSPCAQLLAGHELIFNGLERFEPSVPLDFSVRVAAQFADRSRRSWRGRWIGSVTALAAGLLLAIGILHMLNSPAGDRGLPGDRVVTDPAVFGSTKVDSRPSREVYAQIIDFGDEMRQRIGQQRPEWVAEVADGLKPVADSMSAALHALRRTLPRGEAPVRSSQFEPAILKVADIA